MFKYRSNVNLVGRDKDLVIFCAKGPQNSINSFRGCARFSARCVHSLAKCCRDSKMRGETASCSKKWFTDCKPGPVTCSLPLTTFSQKIATCVHFVEGAPCPHPLHPETRRLQTQMTCYRGLEKRIARHGRLRVQTRRLLARVAGVTPKHAGCARVQATCERK